MEDVLDLYHEEYDPERPVVCFDESSKQLLGDIEAKKQEIAVNDEFALPAPAYPTASQQLYGAPPEARRIAKRLEHHTPNHGSWLHG